ncbi:MAG: hypothetical protein ACOCYP_11225 [Planctomycetota bacterium]
MKLLMVIAALAFLAGCGSDPAEREAQRESTRDSFERAESRHGGATADPR